MLVSNIAEITTMIMNNVENYFFFVICRALKIQLELFLFKSLY